MSVMGGRVVEVLVVSWVFIGIVMVFMIRVYEMLVEILSVMIEKLWVLTRILVGWVISIYHHT